MQGKADEKMEKLSGENWEIGQADLEDWEDAITLAWKTFLKFEAKDYGPMGVKNFRNFLSDAKLHRMFVLGKYLLFVAKIDGETVGMITLRDETHISLLFVSAEYHHMGIGSSLIEYVQEYIVREQMQNQVTVDAAPYAADFYRKLGFQDIGQEQRVEGIRFVPMRKCL